MRRVWKTEGASEATMEEYLQYMKTLRSQINDVEYEAAKISAEEQIHFTTLETLQNDLLSDTGAYSTGKISLPSKLIGKSTYYYSKVAKDFSTKLQQQQDWVKSGKAIRKIEEQGLVNNKFDEQMTESKGNFSVENHLIKDNVNIEAVNDLVVKLDLAKAKLDGIAKMKAKLVRNNGKIKESIEQAKCEANHFKPELLETSMMTLEDEYKALLLDKDGESD